MKLLNYFNSNILVITIIILSIFSLCGTFDSVYANHIYISINSITAIEYDPDGDGFTDITWDVLVYEKSNPDVLLDVSCPATSPTYNEGYLALIFGQSAKDIYDNGGSFNTGYFIVNCDYIYPDGTSGMFDIVVEIIKPDVELEVMGDIVATYNSAVTNFRYLTYDITDTIDDTISDTEMCMAIASQFQGITSSAIFYPGIPVQCIIYSSDNLYYNFYFTMTISRSEDPVIDPPDLVVNSSGCNDCTPPTLGLDKNFNRIVDYGFSYNDNITQVEYWHTPYPLINATVGDTNLVEIIVYENGGINNMERVQFGLGAEDIGQSLSTLEVLVDVELETFGTLEDIEVKEIIITDENNLIDNDTVLASTHVVKCQNDSLEDHCVKIDLEYSYREATFNHIMVVNAADRNHNSQNFWFNDGVQVMGESINEPKIFTMQNKNSNQQTEDIFLTLTLVDKFTETWVDKYGIEYLQVSDNSYSRITPLEQKTCDNTPYSIVTNPDRRSCQFKMLFEYELDRVTQLAKEYYN